ncbi:MAG: hypothetical protein SPI53_00100 [Erysipelotrichaceae bacterium]|nr:hypothetical protein [Erysipelotrichaceae bacterium]
MVKVRRKKQKRIKASFVYRFFLFSVFVSIFSSLFLHSYNTGMIIAVQKDQDSIAKIKTENEVLKVKIQNLVSQDRVYKVAETSGMSVKEDSVIRIAE